MGLEANKTVYRRFVEEVINQGKLEPIDELYAEDYIDHNAPPGAPPGLAAVRMIPTMFRGAFPDVEFTIDEMIAEGDLVATRVTGRGTNTGSFMGRPPSNNRAVWGSKGIFRVRDGKIIEHWGQPDMLALMSQIGALPPQAQIHTPSTTDTSSVADTPPADPHDAGWIARNKAVIAQLFEAGFSQGDMSVIDQIVSPQYLDHPPARWYDLPTVGPEAIKAAISLYRAALPDLREDISISVAEGNSVATLSSRHGVNTGAFGGVPPTNKPVTVTGINFFRLDADGKIVERFGSLDTVGLMMQLGMMPGPPH